MDYTTSLSPVNSPASPFLYPRAAQHAAYRAEQGLVAHHDGLARGVVRIEADLALLCPSRLHLTPTEPAYIITRKRVAVWRPVPLQCRPLCKGVALWTIL